MIAPAINSCVIYVGSNMFGVYFERKDDGRRGVHNGGVVLGGYETVRFEGEPLWADPLTTAPGKWY